MDLTSIYNENVLIDINNLNTFLNQKKGNIDDFILIELKKKIGNKCNKDGFVIKNSIQIIFRNCGEFKFNEKILYKIKFSANILFPTEGCLLENCKIIFISKVLYIAKPDDLNLIILLPKKFIDNSHNLKKNINVVCLDKFYQLNDKFMFIIGIPHFTNSTQEYISNNSINDNMCQNILEEFQKSEEYDWINQKFFEDKIQTSVETFDIDYISNSSIIKNTHSNFILMNLLKELNNILKNYNNFVEYQINTTNFTTYDDIFNIIELINNGQHLHITSLYLNYKLDLINFIKFDPIQYRNNLNQINSNIFIENNTKNIINNETKNCYIISTINILQNCKIFKKKLQNLIQSSSSFSQDYLQLINSLYQLINGNITDITDFKNILISHIQSDNTFIFDLNNLHNIYDFINILFYFIDKNKDNTTYIYNVYNEILEEKNYIKKDNKNNIKYYIEELLKKQDDLLKEFYSISVNEYVCSECQFKSYHMKNKFTINLNINQHNTIANCIHHSTKTPTDINGIKCPVCEGSTIKKKSYLYKNPQDYLLCDINRIIYESENSIKKNLDELFINNRIYYKIINKDKSFDNLVFDNYILDLKSIICHIGTISNGYYISLNKNKNDLFEIQLEDKNYFVKNSDFYDLSIFKKYVSNVVYQINNIDNPMSDIHLLLYEDYYFNNHNSELKSFENFIKNEVGIKVSSFTGGSSSTTKSTTSSDNPLTKLINSELITYKNLIILLNEIFDTTHINIDFNETNAQLKYKINTFWLQNMKYINNSINILYNKIIVNYINKLKYKLITYTEQITFLNTMPSIDFLYDLNKIYIGSTGYNINTTNHWDVIYSSSPNQLDLYSQHFNSIEINDTYYNDQEQIIWTKVQNNLTQLENSKFKCSILFNISFSNFIMNTNISDLQTKIENEFNIYWNNRIELIEDYIENIVFIFNTNFEYNRENFDKLKLLNDTICENYKDHINFVFEIYNNDWYNISVSDYFIAQNLTFVSLIVNNDNSDFGYNFDSETNFEFINTKNFPISYIKLYGSKYKYNGSHTSDLYKIIKTIKDNDLIDTTFISKINPNKEHFIYFNNLETDFNNIRYHPKYSSDDETFTSDEDVSIKGGTDTQQKDDISQKYTSELPQDQSKTQELDEDIKPNKNEDESKQEEEQKEDESKQEDESKEEEEQKEDESKQEDEQNEDESKQEYEQNEDKPKQEEEQKEDESKEENELTDENISVEEPDYSSIEDETSSDNMNMPSAVFDAKCLYHILEKINK